MPLLNNGTERNKRATLSDERERERKIYSRFSKCRVALPFILTEINDCFMHSDVNPIHAAIPFHLPKLHADIRKFAYDTIHCLFIFIFFLCVCFPSTKSAVCAVLRDIVCQEGGVSFRYLVEPVFLFLDINSSLANTKLCVRTTSRSANPNVRASNEVCGQT